MGIVAVAENLGLEAVIIAYIGVEKTYNLGGGSK
jgi:hypothetical protein